MSVSSDRTPVPVGVVTIARGRHEHWRRQRELLARSAVPAAVHVLVSMGDATLAAWDDGLAPPIEHVALDVPDGVPLPLATARNMGVAAAIRRGCRVVIGLDVDCLPGEQLVGRYLEAARRRPDSLLCGPVAYLPEPGVGGYDLDRLDHLARPHPARPDPPAGELEDGSRHRELFWSLSYAATAATWARIGGFDERYQGYGAEDTDVSYRAEAAGVPMTWVGGALAYHQWHPVSDPPAEHLADILRNGALFAEQWGWWPMQGWLDAFVQRGLIAPDGSGGYAALDPPA